MFRTPEHCLYICAVKYVKEPLLCNWLVLSGVTLKCVGLLICVPSARLCRTPRKSWLLHPDTWLGCESSPLLSECPLMWEWWRAFYHFLSQRLIKDICFLRNLTLLITPRDVFITKVHGLQGSALVLSWVHAFVFVCLMSVRSLLSSKERTQIPQIRP